MCPLLILAPFFSIIILNLLPKRVGYKIGFWSTLGLTLLQMAVVFYPQCAFWRVNEGIFGNIFKFNFLIDNLTLVMLFCIGLTVFITLIVSREFIEAGDKKLNFINIILIALAGMNGAVLTRDIFSLYVFFEITAVASFILMAFDKDLFAFEGAFKYIVFSALASAFMISAIALLFMLTDSMDFSVMRSSLKAVEPGNIIFILSTGLFFAAFFIKSGLMPFHSWLPDAHSSAPPQVSILLAGIIIKVTGLYALIRVTATVLGFSVPIKSVLLIMGAVSVILGALAALGQSDFKRMLAYSSVSQVGYIVLGLGSGTIVGIAGAVLHIFNHSVFKSLLFVNAAAVEKQAGTRDMDKMSGLSQRMPLTGFSSVLASLSCAGLPPLAGFWSKLLIIIGLWEAGYYVYASVAVIASVITLAYLLSLQRRVFFGKIAQHLEKVKEAGFDLVFPMLLLSMIIVGFGVFTPFILNKFIQGFRPVLGG